jgi:putative ABC transport system permease protein
MRTIRGFLVRLNGLFGKESKDRDLAEELETHLQMQIEDNIRAGMAPEQARRQALLKSGGLEPAKEAYRDRRGLPAVETLMWDLRYTARIFRRGPTFTAVAVLSLGLGIGASTTVFTTLNALVRRPLAFRDPGMLAMIREVQPREGWSGISPGNFLDLRAGNRVFEEMALIGRTEATLTGMGEPEKLVGAEATAAFFPLLGQDAERGRLPQAGEDAVVVLSHALWERRFGKQESILGSTVTLDGRARIAIGVLPPGFRWFDNPAADFWIPLTPGPSRSVRPYTCVARLKRGESLEAAQAAMAVIARRLERQYRENRNWQVRVTSLESEIHGPIGPAMIVLFTAVSFIQLIVCVNVAGLLLARVAGRGKEMAVRAALGAGRTRIVRQLLTESLALSTLGGLLGLLLAFWGVRVLAATAPPTLGLAADLAMDGRVFLYVTAISIFSGLISGVAPALRYSRVALGVRAGGTRSRFLQTLVVSEVSLAVVLAIAAGLVMRTFVRIEATPLGIRAQNLLTLKLELPKDRYGDTFKQATFSRELLERIRALPGVEAAGAVDSLPLSGRSIDAIVHIPERGDAHVQQIGATPGYFAAAGIHLRRGRAFGDADRLGSERVAIVNAVMAAKYWPNQDPVGRNVVWRGETGAIVGVADVVRQSGPLRAPEPQMYFPLLQTPGADLFLAIRTYNDPLGLAGAVRHEIHAMDAGLPVTRLATMEQLARDVTAPQRVMTWLIGSFAVFAVGLAAIGVFGVVAYSASRRTHEFAVRVALGADAQDVLALVLRRGLVLAAGGSALGLAVAWPLSRGLAALLYGLDPKDMFVFISVPLLLASVALGASYVPARRAAKIDPATALRSE